MNIEILYLVFPLVMLPHVAEEILTRGRWLVRRGHEVAERCPLARKTLLAADGLPAPAFAALTAAELAFAALAAAWFANGTLWLLLAVLYAFAFHLLERFALALAACGYVPGLVTALLAAPYCAVAIRNLIIRFGWGGNAPFAAVGLLLFLLAPLAALVAGMRRNYAERE